jgi:rhodanese-related sulfurtransferase
MKMFSLNKEYILLLVVIFLSFCFTSCLEDPSPTSIDYKLTDTALLLHYLEEQGDYINTSSAPSTISAEQIFSNPGVFNIIDLRSIEKFEQGRIPNSINLKSEELISYFENSVNDTMAMILVSQSGQQSSYFTTLLRFWGYYNVYSLNFGIASWNNDFAQEVLAERDLLSLDNELSLDNTIFPKSDFSPLPELILESSDNMKLNIQGRINSVWNKEVVVQNLPLGSNSAFVICYGDLNLYKAHALEGPTPGEGHPNGVVHYLADPIFELKSTAYLQTIPSNKKIIIYTLSGQLGASIAAYLRVLGYDAYSLNYGASQFIYERLAWGEYTKLYVFDESKVMNYPYDK